MKFRIVNKYLIVMIILIASPLKAQHPTETYLIIVNLDNEKLVGMKDVSLMELLNNKIGNERQNIVGAFNVEFPVPLRILILENDRVVFSSVFINKDRLFDHLNEILWRLNKL